MRNNSLGLSGYLKPQEKHNIKIDVNDFRAATNTGWEKQLPGEDIFIIDIKIPFKYLYIPSCPFDTYLHSTKYINLIKVSQNILIPIDIIDKIILVKPTDLTSGYMYFQYWLSNIESIKIFDMVDWYDFTLVKNGVFQKYELPFPSFQIKVLLKLPTNPTSIDFNISSYPFRGDGSVILDNKDGITGSPLWVYPGLVVGQG